MSKPVDNLETIHTPITIKERPILFSGPMVRAILEGRKTQTRRLVKHPEYYGCPTGDCPHETQRQCDEAMNSLNVICDCHFGQPGDRLWVRESVGRRPASFLGITATNGVEQAFYAADGENVVGYGMFDLCPWWQRKTLPAIHMPRWASRITLEITGVQVERVQDICDGDVMREGVTPLSPFGELQDAYATLWDSINGKGSWDANPWVWVISFKRVEGK